MRILQNMMSGSHYVLSLTTRMWDPCINVVRRSPRLSRNTKRWKVVAREL